MSPPRDTAYDAGYDLDEGYRYLQAEDYRTAHLYLFRALDTVRHYGSPAEIFRAYDYLHYLFSCIEEPRQMVRFAELAYAMREQLDLTDRADTYRLLVEAYDSVDRMDKALSWSEEWGKFLEDHPGPVPDVLYFDHHAYRGSLQASIDRPPAAIASYEQALTYGGDGTVSETKRQEALSDIGWAYSDLGQPHVALPYLENYLCYSETIGDSSNLEDDLLLLAELYEQTGNLPAALVFTRRGYEMQVRQFVSQVAMAGDGLALRDELHEQDALIEEQTNRISTQQRNQLLTLGVAILILLGASGLFFGLRSNRRKNDLLAARNEENETLLKEIHHRVKNNLEVISSLLELQSETLADSNARDAMRAGQSRVASMGLLHQKLYQGTDLATVNMRTYLGELTASISETYEMDEWVEFRVAVPSDLSLDVDRAVTVGLIVNELVTNSLKYAFPEAAGGKITVQLSQTTTGHHLTVSDNGGGVSQAKNQ
ncbi:MAG: sensor histidine kinase, partial [Bacteroidota bacterium]